MKLAVIALSQPGLKVARRIRRFFPGSSLFTPEHFYSQGLKAFVGSLFGEFQGMIMIMAAGIAVRVIAPYLKDKKTDPAVVVVDDTGLFAVSLLSGHLGGANRLAEEVAWKIGALPVITTATDRHQLLAFDLLAVRMNWAIEREKDLTKISALQVEGKEIMIIPDEAIKIELKNAHGSRPPSVKSAGRVFREALLKKDRIPLLGRIAVAPSTAEFSRIDAQGFVFISSRSDFPRPPQNRPFIVLRPRNIWAGVGCRRGTAAGDLVKAVQEAFHHCGRAISSLQGLVTAELKAREPGLCEAAEFFGVPLKICSKEEIGKVEHLFAQSPFVRKHTGSGSVAEPCAFLAGRQGEMILGKRVFPGITVALCERPLHFRWAREEEKKKGKGNE